MQRAKREPVRNRSRNLFGDCSLESPVELDDRFRIEFPVAPPDVISGTAAADGQHRAGAHLEMQAGGQIQQSVPPKTGRSPGMAG